MADFQPETALIKITRAASLRAVTQAYSKVKCFRTQVRGVADLPFFMYRLAKIFG